MSLHESFELLLQTIFSCYLQWYINPERITVYVRVKFPISSNPRAVRVIVWVLKIPPFRTTEVLANYPKNRKTLCTKGLGKFHTLTLSTDNQYIKWRRERDSNPRYSCLHTRFPSVLFKPLRHLSKLRDRRL